MPHFARHLAAAFVSLFAVASAGCAGGGDVSSPEQVDDNQAAFGLAQGVDYSWGRPSPAGLAAAGYTFAARYLTRGSSGKNVSRAEADALTGAGVALVLVFEQEADSVLGGYDRGFSDAQFAAGMAADVGQPQDKPIYFAVDFDAQPGQQGTINAYFDGVAAAIGRGRAGAYGGFSLISRLFDAGKITWGWQAYAWSYGNWDSRAQVRQTRNDQTVAGADVDLDVAMVDDFGQWGGSDCNEACANFGCQCVDGQCSGGFCPGTGCSAAETAACGNYGVSCVDHKCSGGFGPGTGCTARETLDCGSYGVNCVDHKCSGGFGPGSGCTARETLDCGNYGCDCVDHQCSGGFCPGTGCTAHETLDCEGEGRECHDHRCVGGN